MATGRYTLRPRPRWTSGVLTCLALFALGGALLWGLFRAPRAGSPASPDAPWAPPPRALRVVCVDLGAWTGEISDAAALIQSVDPDFVLAQRVPGGVVLQLAESLGMQRSFHPQHFVRLGGDAAPGCLVLSKHPLYDAATLRPEMSPRVSLGVWAVSVVDGCRFAVASADGGARLGEVGVPALAAAASLDGRQESLGRPPLVAAFRAPGMHSTRARLLDRARLVDAFGADARELDAPDVSPLIAVAGAWRVEAETASRPRALAPGIVWVEVRPQDGPDRRGGRPVE